MNKMLNMVVGAAVSVLIAVNVAVAAPVAGDFSYDNGRVVTVATVGTATNVVFTNVYGEAWTPIAIMDTDTSLSGSARTNTYAVFYTTSTLTQRCFQSSASVGGAEVAQIIKDYVPTLRKTTQTWSVYGNKSNTQYTVFYRAAILQQ